MKDKTINALTLVPPGLRYDEITEKIKVIFKYTFHIYDASLRIMNIRKLEDDEYIVGTVIIPEYGISFLLPYQQKKCMNNPNNYKYYAYNDKTGEIKKLDDMQKDDGEVIFSSRYNQQRFKNMGRYHIYRIPLSQLDPNAVDAYNKRGFINKIDKRIKEQDLRFESMELIEVGAELMFDPKGYVFIYYDNLGLGSHKLDSRYELVFVDEEGLILKTRYVSYGKEKFEYSFLGMYNCIYHKTKATFTNSAHRRIVY